MVENVIWPAYFDADLTRSKGRRVPEELAVPAPELEEIAQAVQQVGYDAVVERDVAYPREHYQQRGRVLVKDADDSKNDVVQAVAAYVATMRE